MTLYDREQLSNVFGHSVLHNPSSAKFTGLNQRIENSGRADRHETNMLVSISEISLLANYGHLSISLILFRRELHRSLKYNNVPLYYQDFFFQGRVALDCELNVL